MPSRARDDLAGSQHYEGETTLSRKNTVRLAALPITFVLLTAACGSSKKAATPATTKAGAATTAAAGGAVALKGTCPDKIVIQTDWFPEAEHGALYEMVGDGYTVDVAKKTVTGPLWAGGKDTGVQIEVRTGGPAIGFAPVSQQMYTDKSITLGYTSHDDAANSYADTPTLSVVAPLEKNPQMVMWDPATYLGVKTIKELAAKGARINIFAGGAWMQVLIKEGQVPKELVDETYDGAPAKFISAGGKLAQQGFATSEPNQYKNFKEWGKEVAYQTVDDAGFKLYSQPLGIRTADLATLSPCLKKFVPVVQQATVDAINKPERSNKIIVDAVAKFKDFWVYTDGDATFGVVEMKKGGFVSNGPDATIGNFDMARVQKTIDQMIAAGITKVPKDLKADKIATNEFIDPKIKL
jgi:hypothetical protein